jgi:cysteine synthase B
MGVGRFLRDWAPDARLIAMQPDSPFHGLEGLKHMESAIVPGIYDSTLADQQVQVDTEEAHEMVKRLAREEGVLVGISSAANLIAALDVANKLEEGVVVTVFTDNGDRYLSERFWEEESGDPSI